MEELDRITATPGTKDGKPCIQGTRVTVSTIVGLLDAGHGISENLADYPYLAREDIEQALRYAARTAGKQDLERFSNP